MPRRPNVLLMIADDHRASAIGAMGDPTVQTPTMDGLIAAGTACEQAHQMGSLCGAVCVPARGCLHTGRGVFHYPQSTALDDTPGQMAIREDLPILPETFRQAGYHTFGTGKWHNNRASFARGFASGATIFFGGMSSHYEVPIQDFDPDGKYPNDRRYLADGFSTDVFTNSAIDFLSGYDGDDPFFCYLAFTSPHDPREAPEPWASMYDPDSIPVPANFLPEHPFDFGELRIRDEVLDAFPRTHAIVQRHIADYYAMITNQDHHMGRVLQALAEAGHADDTIVVYMADHGLSVGQHGLLGKQNMYDHSVRVPCILRGPGVPAGQRISALTYGLDVFPTLCELAGLDIPETVQGRSLVPLMRGEGEGRQTVYSVYKDILRMVKDDRHKLIRNYSGANGTGVDRLQLFDLVEDPWETQDLIDEPALAGVVSRLAGELAGWMEQEDDILKGAPVLV